MGENSDLIKNISPRMFEIRKKIISTVAITYISIEVSEAFHDTQGTTSHGHASLKLSLTS